jgi:hypothetical protein
MRVKMGTGLLSNPDSNGLETHWGMCIIFTRARKQNPIKRVYYLVIVRIAKKEFDNHRI